MNKDLNIVISKINALLKEKKFEKIINEINKNFKENIKPPVIQNILGAAKIFKSSVSINDKLSAAQDFKQAYQNDISFVNPLINFIRLSIELDDFEDAHNLAKKHIEKFGYKKEICQGIARINFKIGNVKESVKYLEKVLDNNDGSYINWTQYLIRLNYNYFFEQKEYLNKCKKFSNSLEVFDSNKLKYSHINNKKIKLGFLSADFRKHPVSSLLMNIAKTINKNKFETYGFSNVIKETYDDETRKYKNIFYKWIDISDLTDLETVNKIRDNNIDVLIHLGGLFDRSRLTVIKNRAAPVQISWMNINTTGVKNMDYLIADNNLIKKNEEDLYSEKIIYMPNIWNVHSGFNDKNLVNDFREIRSKTEIKFGSFNNFDKISDKVIKTWATILNKLNKTKLILRSSSIRNKEYILSKFEKYNLKERIEIKEKIKDEEDFLNSYKEIDLAFDTFPTPGIITTFEALWMGVPVITMKGFNLCSRAGESIMKNINMDELISKNEDDYISKVVNLCNNLDKLNLLRKKILCESKSSKLYNYKIFNEEFEKIILNLVKKDK